MLSFFKVIPIFCIFNFLFLKEVKQNVFQYKKLKGIVYLEYEKKEEFFLLKNQEFITKNQKYYLLYDLYGHILATSDLICNHGYVPPVKTNQSIFDIPLFQSQVDSLKGNLIHYGGDIYKKDENTLVIAFYLISDFLIISNEVCEGHSFQSNYSCIIDRQKINYPCVVITEPKKYKSMNKKSLQRYDLSKTTIKEFHVGFCD